MCKDVTDVRLVQVRWLDGRIAFAHRGGCARSLSRLMRAAVKRRGTRR
jgi:hypothetical protein